MAFSSVSVIVAAPICPAKPNMKEPLSSLKTAPMAA